MNKQKKDSNPFDIVFSINKGKPEYKKESYIPYIINKTFSGWYDTAQYANYMNLMPDLDKDMQFDFYSSIIRPKFRKNNWLKKSKKDNEEVEMIKDKYNVNERIAKQYIKIRGIKNE